MIINRITKYLIFLIAIGIFNACKDSYGPISINENEIIYTKHGVFVINEGNYMAGNGSLSYYHIDSQLVSNEIFRIVNDDLPLGDVVQSMTIVDSIGFVVVNYSKKIEVINVNTYKHISSITGFNSPRYMQIIDENKAYVTDLSSHEIKIVDIQNYVISDYINVGCTTEEMVKIDNEVFAINWSFGNKVLVIDSEQDELIDSIIVTKEPNSIVVDKNNKLWVLSSGGFMNEEIPALTKINFENHQIEKVLLFTDISMNPSRLAINGVGDSLFYLNIGIFKMGIENDYLPEEPIIEANGKAFYGLEIHPERSILFAGDALDFNQNGTVWVYSTNGKEISQFTAGLNPSGFCFKK